MAGRDSLRDVWGDRTPYEGEDAWPARQDERVTETPDRWVQSACVLCSNGCALDIGVKDDGPEERGAKGARMVGVRGRTVDRINRGRLGPKGLYGWAANASADRLTRPLIRHGDWFREASWDEAMDLIVRRSRETLAQCGPSGIGFYSSGQLMLEEYYTLAVIGKAGLGTPHMDGNIRLCTATAGAALKESFGADGQPGSVADLDTTHCILLAGHNAAVTDTVMWMRILDRRRGADPPKLVVIDPRRTPTAAEADVWLAPRLGTNLALLNGLLRLVIANGHVDRAFVERHTLGFAELEATVAAYPPERVETITGVKADSLLRAASLIGAAPSLVSTCLQGIYQSNQATASACAVNNLHLVRGMIGRPGCGVLQMNGQPTAQNTRECGVYEDLSGSRNRENPAHVAELARLWNVDVAKIPHWAPGTPALEIFQYAEAGTLKMLWIQGTNPAVSMPDLPRVRQILSRPDVFVVVQDGFMTETGWLADVVLPAAIWGERTGTFTNFDRTVHISFRAVEPPGEARPDLEIFLDYARRMDFRDKDGAPLVKWSSPEQAFDAWKACSRGRPCDYSGLSYAKLMVGSGVQWPCNDAHPDGAVRLYTDHVFHTNPDECTNFGHDLLTGALITRQAYEALEPAGRAFIKPAHYRPPEEMPDAAYPFLLTTGRVLTQFHTRTKTGRVPELARAAPAAFAEMAQEDARRLGVVDGQIVSVTSRRGSVDVAVKVGDVLSGQVFVPFHYGDWDHPGQARAANELTVFAWDAVSKQPQFKYAAVRVEPAAGLVVTPESSPRSRTIEALAGAAAWAKQTNDGAPKRAHAGDYLARLAAGEALLARSLAQAAASFPAMPDVVEACRLFASWAHAAAARMTAAQARFGGLRAVSGRLADSSGKATAPTGFELVRMLHNIDLLVCDVQISVSILQPAALALRDSQLSADLQVLQGQHEREIGWLRTRLLAAAAQALTVPQ